MYVSGWGVWNAENLDLFYGYRRSFGENRFLMEAPAHFFDSTKEDSFVSILSMVFYFVWDAWLFDIEGTYLLRISHDEWLEIRSGSEDLTHEFEAESDRYGLRLLGR